VEKDFHLEMSTSQGEERIGETARSFNRLELQQQSRVVQSLCECTWVSVETGAYTWVSLKKGLHISKNVKIQGRTTDQELLGFAGVV
jgi:hypothetical protein